MIRHLDFRKLAFIIVIFLVPLACNVPGGSDPEPTSAIDTNQVVETSVAQTVAASSGGEQGGGDADDSPDPTSAGESQDTPTATISATAELTATPSIPVIHVSIDTNCRYGPGTVYDPPVGALLVGESAQVLGKNLEGTFYYIDKNCYVWTNYVTVEAGNINNVPIFTPVPTPTATATPDVPVISFAGTWKSDCQSATCDDVILAINGNQVTGSYANGDGIIEGTITDNRLTGVWKRNNLQGSIDFWLADDGKTWQGNYGGYYAWCGAQDGVSLPNPCGVSTFYGSWKTDCGGANCDEMILEQDGEQVSGTYAGGSGTVSGTVNGSIFSGTWNRNNTSGAFTFFMTTNGNQFQGNYNGSSAWCGYNSGNAFPNPCLKQ